MDKYIQKIMSMTSKITCEFFWEKKLCLLVTKQMQGLLEQTVN